MIEAVLSVKMPGIWVSKVVNRFDIGLKILDTIPLHEDNAEVAESCQELIELKLNNENLEEVVKYLVELPEIEVVELEMVEVGKAIGIVKCKMCSACKDLNDTNCFLVSATTTDLGLIEWSLISSNNDCLRDLIERLKGHGAEATIIKLKKIKEEELLTENQEKIVRTAYERGYYDFPKHIGVKELADMFQISTATLSEILRRGQRKIIENYFEK